MSLSAAQCGLIADLVMDGWRKRSSPSFPSPPSPVTVNFHGGSGSGSSSSRRLSVTSLTSSASSNSSATEEDSDARALHALTIYVSHIAQATQLPLQQLIFATRYIHVLTALHPHLPQLSAAGATIRIFLSAVILANKVTDDHYIAKRSWEHVSCISLSELNRMEMELLNGMDWNVNISEAEFDGWFDYVAQFHRARQYERSGGVDPLWKQPAISPSAEQHATLYGYYQQRSHPQHQLAAPPPAITKRNRSSSHSAPSARPHFSSGSSGPTASAVSTRAAYAPSSTSPAAWKAEHRNRSASQSHASSRRPSVSTLLPLMEQSGLSPTAPTHNSSATTAQPGRRNTAHSNTQQRRMYQPHVAVGILAPPNPHAVQLPSAATRQRIVHDQAVVAPLVRAAVMPIDIGRARSTGYRRASVDHATNQFAKRAAAAAASSAAMNGVVTATPAAQYQHHDQPPQGYGYLPTPPVTGDSSVSLSSLASQRQLPAPPVASLAPLSPFEMQSIASRMHHQHSQQSSPLTLPPLHSILARHAQQGSTEMA
ncbi:hypothetical protein RI367_006309 [Sorochytrium milnesiophthora]